MDSSIFAVVGDEDDSNETTGIYAYSIHSTNKLWFYHGPGIGLDLTFSPNNQVVATPFYGSVIELAVSSGKLVKEIDDQQAVGGKTCIDKLGIRFSPDGTEIFTLNTSFDNFASTAIYEWNIETNQCCRSLSANRVEKLASNLVEDGKFLVLALDAIPKFSRRRESMINRCKYGILPLNKRLLVLEMLAPFPKFLTEK